MVDQKGFSVFHFKITQKCIAPAEEILCFCHSNKITNQSTIFVYEDGRNSFFLLWMNENLWFQFQPGFILTKCWLIPADATSTAKNLACLYFTASIAKCLFRVKHAGIRLL